MRSTEAVRMRPAQPRPRVEEPPLLLDHFALEPEPHVAPQRRPAPREAAVAPPVPAPIIPARSVAGSALFGVIAIMTLLAALVLGGVVLVRGAANEWQGQIAREVTIQVRPAEGRDIEADVARATAIARATPGVADVRAYTREESARLLEPWLGTGVSLDDLPVPRLILVSVSAGAAVDLQAMRAQLAAAVPPAALDDHRGFIDRIRATTRTAILVGIAVLALMLGATVMLVAFATRGAMATNHAIVEVLHFVGAKNRYIAGQFQRHFLAVGLKGGLIGAGAAMALFLAGPYALQHLAAVEGAAAFRLGPDGFAGIAGLMILVAAVTAVTSRWTVHRTLRSLE